MPSCPLRSDLGFTLHDPHQEAAPRGTKRAETRFPGGDAGNQSLLRNETDELVIRAPTGIERGRSARQSRNFEEVTTLHEPSDTFLRAAFLRPGTS